MVELILGIVLALLAVAIVVLVLLQSGKDKKLSGAIAGGAETFFGQPGAGSKFAADNKLQQRIAGLF